MRAVRLAIPGLALLVSTLGCGRYITYTAGRCDCNPPPVESLLAAPPQPARCVGPHCVHPVGHATNAVAVNSLPAVNGLPSTNGGLVPPPPGNGAPALNGGVLNSRPINMPPANVIPHGNVMPQANGTPQANARPLNNAKPVTNTPPTEIAGSPFPDFAPTLTPVPKMPRSK